MSAPARVRYHDPNMRRAAIGLVCLSAACGDPSDGPSDAAQSPDRAGFVLPDAGPRAEAGVTRRDARVEDTGGEAQPVRLTVFDLGRPAGGIVVTVHDSEGGFRGVTTTLEGAPTELAVPSGGMVTVLTEATADDHTLYEAYTWTGVTPGDHLRFGSAESTAMTEGEHTLTVTLSPPPAGTTELVLDAGCGPVRTSTSATTASLSIDGRCIDASQQVSVIALARQRTDAVLAHATTSQVPVSATGTTSVPLGAWQTSGRRVQARLTSIPADGFLGGVKVDPVRGHVVYQGPGHDRTLTSSTTTVAFSIVAPDAFTPGHRVHVDVVHGTPMFPNGVIFWSQHSTQQHPDQIVVDALTDIPPRMADLAVDRAEPGRARIGWLADDDTRGYDGHLLSVTFSDQARTQRWVVVAGPQLNQVRLPQLPADLQGYVPSDEADLVQVQVSLFEIDKVEGYDAFRQELGPRVYQVLNARGDHVIAASVAGVDD